MISWGISANSHNAALAVFADEKLVFASDSERFSGIKNDPHLTQSLVDYALQYGKPGQIYWYEKPWLKTFRQLYAGQGWLAKENNIAEYLKQWNITAPIKTTQHHRSHAAAGYYTSGFDNACVVVIDAIGEFETLTMWSGNNRSLKKIYSQTYPDSIGLWYSAMTQRIGLKPNEEEYILMGMAAYGDANRLSKDILKDFIYFSNDDYQNPFRLKQNLHTGCSDWRPELTTQQDLYDIAAATQLVYEMIFERVLQSAMQRTDSRNLVIMGGCALNCSANPLAYKYFDKVWIMPAPGDNGSAIGAVLAYKPQWAIDNRYYTPFLGYNIPPTSTVSNIVDYLDSNKICGVAQGPAEFGPRALGNRSLLADPRGPNIKNQVNEIKKRQQFRPFAPVILEEVADQYFDLCGTNSDHRYMQFTSRCIHPDLFPAIVHKDNTSRVQTVPNNGSRIRKILEQWYAQTGCPMLLNTSLNIKGKPIVNTQADAREFEAHYGVKVFT
jgi:carbamoyltransferase